MTIQDTGAIGASVQHLAHTFARKPHLQKFFIPVTMTLFSIGGAVFGMAESAMPFVLIFIPLALSLGYDTIDRRRRSRSWARPPGSRARC